MKKEDIKYKLFAKYLLEKSKNKENILFLNKFNYSTPRLSTYIIDIEREIKEKETKGEIKLDVLIIVSSNFSYINMIQNGMRTIYFRNDIKNQVSLPNGGQNINLNNTNIKQISEFQSLKENILKYDLIIFDNLNLEYLYNEYFDLFDRAISIKRKNGKQMTKIFISGVNEQNSESILNNFKKFFHIETDEDLSEKMNNLLRKEKLKKIL